MTRKRTDGKVVMNIELDGRLAQYMIDNMAPNDCPNNHRAVATRLLEMVIRDHKRICQCIAMPQRHAKIMAGR